MREIGDFLNEKVPSLNQKVSFLNEKVYAPFAPVGAPNEKVDAPFAPAGAPNEKVYALFASAGAPNERCTHFLPQRAHSPLPAMLAAYWIKGRSKRSKIGSIQLMVLIDMGVLAKTTHSALVP